MSQSRALKEIASIIRSKNAGPFEITFDIMFPTKVVFEKVMASNAITPQLISQLYHVPEKDIITFCPFGTVNALKITIPRPRDEGSVGECDMHAAQQHVPLMDIHIPWED